MQYHHCRMITSCHPAVSSQPYGFLLLCWIIVTLCSQTLTVCRLPPGFMLWLGCRYMTDVQWGLHLLYRPRDSALWLCSLPEGILRTDSSLSPQNRLTKLLLSFLPFLSMDLLFQALGPEALIPLTLLAPLDSCAMLCGDPRYCFQAFCCISD